MAQILQLKLGGYKDKDILSHAEQITFNINRPLQNFQFKKNKVEINITVLYT